jgi:CheY-like chemotaxis protein
MAVMGTSAAIRVLVADDCEMNRVLARSLLTKLGCEVTLVEDGQAACAAVSAQTFDMVFMDCEMPSMDGLEATREIRRAEGASHRPRVAIVALTASSEASDRERCLAAGMDDFVSKPFKREYLAAALQRNAPPLPDRASGQ